MVESVIDNRQPSLVLTEYLETTGIFPARDEPGGDSYFTLGQIGIFAGNFAAAGLTANGQALLIQQNVALFSLLGTSYGGNGTTNFRLPDLAGTTLVGSTAIGQTSGTTTVQEPASSTATYDNTQPSLGITYQIAVSGVSPTSLNALDTIGMVSAFAGNFATEGYLPADGRLLNIADYQALFAVIGTTYGGNGQTTFALPDLRGRDVVGASATTPLGATFGQSTATLTNAPGTIDNRQPSLALNYLIAIGGIYPAHGTTGETNSTPVVGQIVAFAGSVANLPVNSLFVPADGRLLNIGQNQALFSILGTTYGGDGVRTFALPDLRGETVLGTGQATDGTLYSLGQTVGTASVAQPVVDPVMTSGSATASTASPLDTAANVTFTLALNEAVAVHNTGHGLPTLALSDGGVATYSGLLDQAVTTLTFSYTVPYKDQSADLVATDFNALPLGTTILDSGSKSLNLASFQPVDTGHAVAADTPCYMTGTRIATTRGLVAVEDLRVGDLAVTAFGEARPVQWIGHRSLDLLRHATPAAVMPVRVAAGAFGDNLPLRDLWVSPKHALYADGMLVPADALLNGTTIAQVPRAHVTYWHVELESHDVLLAEGLPAESFLDCDNRSGFVNGGPSIDMHPDFEPKQRTHACAPMRRSGFDVEALRARLQGRADEQRSEVRAYAEG